MPTAMNAKPWRPPTDPCVGQAAHAGAQQEPCLESFTWRAVGTMALSEVASIVLISIQDSHKR